MRKIDEKKRLKDKTIRKDENIYNIYLCCVFIAIQIVVFIFVLLVQTWAFSLICLQTVYCYLHSICDARNRNVFYAKRKL